MQRLPWVVDDAIPFLREVVQPGCRVLEFGGGGSTLFFRDLGAEVVTVESNPKWAKPLQKEGADVRVFNPVTQATGLPRQVDLLFVDNRDAAGPRPKVVQKFHKLVKPGGLFVLDNANRPKYASIYYLLRHWPMTLFRQAGKPISHGQPGGRPDLLKTWETAAWRRPT